MCGCNRNTRLCGTIDYILERLKVNDYSERLKGSAFHFDCVFSLYPEVQTYGLTENDIA